MLKSMFVVFVALVTPLLVQPLSAADKCKASYQEKDAFSGQKIDVYEQAIATQASWMSTASMGVVLNARRVEGKIVVAVVVIRNESSAVNRSVTKAFVPAPKTPVQFRLKSGDIFELPITENTSNSGVSASLLSQPVAREMIWMKSVLTPENTPQVKAALTQPIQAMRIPLDGGGTFDIAAGKGMSDKVVERMGCFFNTIQ
jgi:hypothetical protein